MLFDNVENRVYLFTSVHTLGGEGRAAAWGNFTFPDSSFLPYLKLQSYCPLTSAPPSVVVSAMPFGVSSAPLEAKNAQTVF